MITRIGLHITWFLPKPWHWTDASGHIWHDANAQFNNEGGNASGLPIETPGIAFPNNDLTLGGWWEIDFSVLRMVVVTRQVDIGPKKPVIDLSAPLAYQMFGSSKHIVDYSPWTATYLGKHKQEDQEDSIVRK